jgi:hypothetical protein
MTRPTYHCQTISNLYTERNSSSCWTLLLFFTLGNCLRDSCFTKASSLCFPSVRLASAGLLKVITATRFCNILCTVFRGVTKENVWQKKLIWKQCKHVTGVTLSKTSNACLTAAWRWVTLHSASSIIQMQAIRLNYKLRYGWCLILFAWYVK